MPLVFANILQPLIDGCEAILLFFHDTVGVGWGASIILLTVTVRLVLLPLTLKQVKSMQRLSALAPELRRIQEKYRHDRQRQQQEMMRFYQENRVNPLASCLPLLLQFPFFIALYYLLRDDLREEICNQTAKACSEIPGFADSARFLFLPDLTDRATGAALVVMVILYVTTQVASMLLSTTTMDRNQRMIMLALPLVFVVFIVNFPAGLMVYWITTNLWTIVQQAIVRKTVGLPQRPALAGAPAGAAALSGGGGGGRRRRAGRVSAAEGGRPVTTAERPARRPGGPPPSARRRKKKRTGRRR